MRRILTAVLLSAVLIGTAGCGEENVSNAGPDSSRDDTAAASGEMTAASEEMSVMTESESITDEAALASIKNYCHEQNPELEEIEKAGEYPVYWEIASSDADEIVVLFRSYTGAEVRYYIDRSTGDTYVTEFVSGITPEEERTEETFNVRDY